MKIANIKPAARAFLAVLKNGQPDPVETRVLRRLDEESMQKLEKRVRPPSVDKETTEISAGFLLGIQNVLKVLRDGF